MAADTAPRREQLIEQLMEVFLSSGFLHLSVGQMASQLRCSKSTLYSIAASKEQIVTAVVRAFFKRATDRIEASTSDAGTPAERIAAYLDAIARELRPAGPAFFADLDFFAPAKEIYQHNTQIAAVRVQALVSEGLAAGVFSLPNAKFIGAVAGQTMELIQRGQIEAQTGLDDSAAYRALAELIVAGMTSRTT